MSNPRATAKPSPAVSGIQQQQQQHQHQQVCGKQAAAREIPNVLTPAPTSPIASPVPTSTLTLTTIMSTPLGNGSTLNPSSNDPSLIRRQPTPHATVETTKILRTQDSSNPTWKMLNQYRVMKLLGKGTHGSVKYCENMQKEDPSDPDYAVAIKIIKRMGTRKRLPRADGRDRTNSALSRIRHEVAVMKRCHHDHIVRLIEVIDDPRSLNVFLVHYMGIIHRDIKPANMLWTKKRARVKLTDFGVACFSKPVGTGGDSENDDVLLKTEGTPAFYAPEQAYNFNGLPIPTFPPGQRPPGVKGNQIYPMTKALDIWAFGVSIFCFLFGRPPYWGESVHILCKAIIEDDYTIPEVATCDQILVESGGEDLADALETMKGMMTKPVYARMTLAQAKRARWLTSDLEDPEAWIKKTDPETTNDAIVLTADEPKEAVASKDHAPRVSSIMQALFNRRTRNRNNNQHRREDAKSIRAGPSVVSLEVSTHRQLPQKSRTFLRQSGDNHHQPLSPVDLVAGMSAASSPTGNTHFGDGYFTRVASSNASVSSKVGGLTRMVSSLFRRSKKSSSAEAIMSAPPPITPIVPRPLYDFSASSSPPNGMGVISQRSSVTVGTAGGPGETDLDPLLITYSTDEEEDEDEEGDVQLLGFGGFDTDIHSNDASASEALRSLENFGHFDPERSVVSATSGFGSVIGRSSTAHQEPPRVVLPRYHQHTRAPLDDPTTETITSAPSSPHQESIYILGTDVLNPQHSSPMRRQGRTTERLTRSLGQMDIRSTAEEDYDSEEEEEGIEIRRNRTRFHES
ncbi:hypothetical protein FRC17_009828 [Serendipita sp. 399]|nr:hypothetical protein FRC17_009828 [Serendipita sp. 399]